MGFGKKHEFLVCVDSDGCVMDTMNCKHFHCFGPCMVAEWGLEEWQEEIDTWESVERKLNYILDLLEDNVNEWKLVYGNS